MSEILIAVSWLVIGAVPTFLLMWRREEKQRTKYREMVDAAHNGWIDAIKNNIEKSQEIKAYREQFGIRSPLGTTETITFK